MRCSDIENAECIPGPTTIQVLGTRKLNAPRTCGRVADFTFEELCAQVLKIKRILKGKSFALNGSCCDMRFYH